MIETVGSGVVAFDYDGDGDDDLLFVDSGDPAPHVGAPGRTKLLQNDGGRFVDVTEASGIRLDSYGMGAVTADVDGDGDAGRLSDRLRSRTGSGSTGATAPSPPRRTALVPPTPPGAPPRPSATSTWTATSTCTWRTTSTSATTTTCAAASRRQAHARTAIPMHTTACLTASIATTAAPEAGPVFVEAADEVGLAGPRHAGLGVVITDFDGDRRPDIYVANDMDPNLHFVNRTRRRTVRASRTTPCSPAPPSRTAGKPRPAWGSQSATWTATAWRT